MTRPLQTAWAASAETALNANTRKAARSKGLSCIVDLLCCVVGRQRLQPLGPEDGDLVVGFAFENRHGAVRIGRWVHPRLQDLGEVFRLFTRLMLTHVPNRRDDKQAKPTPPHPTQPP